jgi:hypothetical protein
VSMRATQVAATLGQNIWLAIETGGASDPLDERHTEFEFESDTIVLFARRWRGRGEL